MTLPDKPTLTAKEVAKHLDRRQRRRKVVLWLALAAAIAAAVLYGTCGHGWGLGGRGDGDGDGHGSGSMRPVAAVVDAAPRRCQVFVAAEGITVDGTRATRDEAVAACRATAGADVVVAGDAKRGDWEALEAALAAAKIDVYRRLPGAAPDAGPP